MAKMLRGNKFPLQLYTASETVVQRHAEHKVLQGAGGGGGDSESAEI